MLKGAAELQILIWLCFLSAQNIYMDFQWGRGYQSPIKALLPKAFPVQIKKKYGWSRRFHVI